jgi:hypothetical protein
VVQRSPGRGEDPLPWLARRLGLPFICAWLVLIALTALTGREDGSWGAALSMGIGTRDPFDSSSEVRSIPLALMGWLAVPAIVGVAVSLLAEAARRRSRPHTTDDVPGYSPTAPTGLPPQVVHQDPPVVHREQVEVPKSSSGDLLIVAEQLGYERHVSDVLARYRNRARVEGWMQFPQWYFVHCGDFHPEAPPGTRDRRAIVAALSVLLAQPDVGAVIAHLQSGSRRTRVGHGWRPSPGTRSRCGKSGRTRGGHRSIPARAIAGAR